MPWVDLALLIILASFAVNGLMQGFIRQVAGLAGLLCGLVLASAFYRGLAASLALSFGFATDLEPLAFVVILLGVWILANLMAAVARGRLRSAGPEGEATYWPDDLGGAALGLVAGVLILASLALGVLRLGLPIGRQVQASRVGAWLLEVADHAGGILSRWLDLP